MFEYIKDSSINLLSFHLLDKLSRIVVAITMLPKPKTEYLQCTQ